MPKFDVTLPVEVERTVRVEAKDEVEAEMKALMEVSHATWGAIRIEKVEEEDNE